MSKYKIHIPILILGLCSSLPALDSTRNPYADQIVEQITLIRSPDINTRAGAAEALGYLRAYSAADTLALALKDDIAAGVRREAALSLGWCGSGKHVEPLLQALADRDWTVRQAAWVALTNITGQEIPFDGLAKPIIRNEHTQAWRDWWSKQPKNRPLPEVIHRLQNYTQKTNLAQNCSVTASTTYKGPPDILTDGDTQDKYWQTKNVPFPQHGTVDLGKVQNVGCVTVYQYGPGFCLTEYALTISTDGIHFTEICRERKLSDPVLTISFASRPARYIRIISYASQNKTYPMTFREIEVMTQAPAKQTNEWLLERGVRALGALGGKGAAEAIAKVLTPYRKKTSRTFAEKTLVQAALRSLGRLSDPDTLPLLIEFLDNPQCARYAADALGDFGGPQAGKALLMAYPEYARNMQGKNPQRIPQDDRPGFEAVDRMYETPYAIIAALARIDHGFNEENLVVLREVAPLITINLTNDFDGAKLYDPEAYQLITAYLLDRAGMRRQICVIAFQALGVSLGTPVTDMEKNLLAAAKRSPGDVPNAASWLPVICRDQTDVPKLITLLEHENGWVRLNAAKALMFLGTKNAVAPIHTLLSKSKPEAEYGFNGKFFFTNNKIAGQAEYNDPPPRWREAFIRALGRLGAIESVPLLIKILNDDRNVLEMQFAAATALDEIGSDLALEALQQAQMSHPFHSVQLYAREALWHRNMLEEKKHNLETLPTKESQKTTPKSDTSYPVFPPAIVFIKGNNDMPNDFQIDIWRTTYSTTDSGPTYRLGENLYILQPPAPNGKITQLTNFQDGYVADCEVSWDGKKVIFAHREGATNPWWHIYEIQVDGTNLRQITNGPYHDVQPIYLPDGRIMFSSSRIGFRDEYHGYYATGLTVMNPDGSDIHCIGFNLGRDNEPALLPNGRVVFSRLELFYSRLKTELTVHAVFPDGTKDVTLYGPERRDFWRNITRLSGEKWWGENPPRHRVLRLTQPQYFDDVRLLCATTGGATIIGPGRYQETILPRDNNRNVTSPFPLPDGRVLCASSVRNFKQEQVDLGLYVMDSKTGKLTLLYNDPQTADFEPRPIMPRSKPKTLAEDPGTRSRSYTARLFCRSAHNSQESRVTQRGKLLRVIEGMPAVTRHHTHLSKKGEAWKNHTGTHARVLGTVPLASDGSFFVEVPADRLLHMQVLDSDRRVVGNQQIWMYARPQETRGCVGCHEKPDTTANTQTGAFPQAMRVKPIPTLPTGGEFTYRAKFWNKGTLTDEGEERTRTVRAVSLIGRQ